MEPTSRGTTSSAVRASLLVIAATGSGSAANFLFQWFAARSFDRDDFSLFAALLAVVTLGVLPGPPAAIAIVRALADIGGSVFAVGLSAARRAILSAGGTIIAVVALAVLLSGVPGFGAPLPASGLFLCVLVTTLSWLVIYPDLARVQAAGDFRRYGGAHARLSLTRLGFGGIALLLDAPVFVVVLAIAIGPWWVRSWLRHTPAAGPPLERPWLRTILPALAATGGLHALVVIDVIFARLHFAENDPRAAGSYAAAATLSRILFHLPFAATAVTVQRTAAATARGENPRSALWTNLALGAALVAVSGGILAAMPGLALRVFAGADLDPGSVEWLRRLLIPMGLASLAAVPAHYLLALGSRLPVVLLGVAPFVLAAWLSRAPADPGGLITPLTGTFATVGAVLLIGAIFHRGGSGAADAADA